MKILLIDNYDSFTYNLKSLLEECGAKVLVKRNDKIQSSDIEKSEAIVFSPGPGIPSEAGQMMDIIQEYYLNKPMLGICLGMQAIGEIFGGELKNLDRPIHGFGAKILHQGDPIFSSLPFEFEAARYHSWVLDKKTILAPLSVLASTKDNQVMAIKHLEFPIYGFQFHPESVLTLNGAQLIKNFIIEAKKYNYAKVTQ
ncbi:MAG: aminodeoxychorismate/anthranilate synthase component II [Crocinitomicaceae bacterium]